MSESSRLDALRRRVDLDPASLAFAALAEEYRRAGQIDEAIETARKGLVKHPGYVSARVTLGRALLEARRFDQACGELESAIQAAPENLAALRALIEAHRGRGAHAEAIAVLERAISTFPQDRELALLQADLLSGQPRRPVVPLTIVGGTTTVAAETPVQGPSADEQRRYRQIEDLERLLFAIVRERSRRAHDRPEIPPC